MQRFGILTKTQVEKVHEASLNILWKIGVDFGYPPAVEVLKKGGAKVDGERVFFPPKLVEEQIKKAPSQFTLYARNPDNNIIIGGHNMVFTPGYGAPFVTDIVNGRRRANLNDFENFVKLTGASVNQNILSGNVVEPNDIPHEIRHAQMYYTSVKYSDKCFMGSSMGEQAAKDTIRMASILYGSEAQLAEKPRFISILCSLTPLPGQPDRSPWPVIWHCRMRKYWLESYWPSWSVKELQWFLQGYPQMRRCAAVLYASDLLKWP